jgi:hypothetical protein
MNILTININEKYIGRLNMTYRNTTEFLLFENKRVPVAIKLSVIFVMMPKSLVINMNVNNRDKRKIPAFNKKLLNTFFT